MHFKDVEDLSTSPPERRPVFEIFRLLKNPKSEINRTQRNFIRHIHVLVINILIPTQMSLEAMVAPVIMLPLDNKCN